jgi:two-component system, OmpR family, sensor histidine kinase KdpD
LIRAAEGQSPAVVQVLDSGPDQPVADLEPVFESFCRVQLADQARAGTGLGRSICRGFVEAVDGTIVAGNRSDVPGAVFTIRLPFPAQGRRTPTKMEPVS